MPRFVGLTGAAGAGKDTAAIWLAQRYPNLRVVQFAQPLKKMIRTLLAEVGVPPAGRIWYTNDPEGKQTPIPQLNGRTARHMMQTLGTEWGRNTQGQDFWLEVAGRGIERLIKQRNMNVGMIFTDVRFPNEAALIRDLGGTMIRIVRPDHENAPDVAAHASESTPVPFDIEIINDGDLPALHRKLARHFPADKAKKR